jgi:hypothetical protein
MRLFLAVIALVIPLHAMGMEGLTLPFFTEIIPALSSILPGIIEQKRISDSPPVLISPSDQNSDALTSYYTRTFADEFQGPPKGISEQERKECFDAAPVCNDMYNGGDVPCSDKSEAYFSQLRALNKCVWKVHRSLNWMSPQINEFDPREVEVHPEIDNGVMLIHGHSVFPDGSIRTPSRLNFDTGAFKDFSKFRSWMVQSGYHCENDNSRFTRRCPFRSGMITSRSDLGGFKQQFGLIQIRGKLSSGPGAWPAYWMLPDASWPGGGEFDLMESWNKDKVSQSYHSGICMPGSKEDLDPNACSSRGGLRWHLFQSKDINAVKTPTKTSMVTRYHNYSLEWTEEKLAFRVDGASTNSIHEGDSISASDDQGHSGQQAVPIPKRPFWVLINHTIGGDQNAPDPELFQDQTLTVDYVRAWKKCETVHDLCPIGGNFFLGQCFLSAKRLYDSPCTRCLYGGSESGADCQVKSFSQPTLNPGVTYWVDTNPLWAGVFYKQVQSACPFGGSISGNGNCVWKYFANLNAKIQYWVDTDPRWPGIYYRNTFGLCRYGGVISRNGNCQLIAFQTPSQPYLTYGVNYWADGDVRWPGVYYKQVRAQCPYGGVLSGNGNCQLTPLTPGLLEDQLIYWVNTDPRSAGVFYHQSY